jgi:NitT/TauT family transport system substrate-binding protein
VSRVGLALLLVLIAAPHVRASDRLTVGVLKFGTVNWQLRTVKDHRLDQTAGVDLEILPLASKNATSVALQAGSADMIVTDWIWALRQRAEGEDFVFVPYTRSLGALVLARGVAIDDLAGLKGMRIGIAGGPLDKSWLVMRASTLRHLNFNIAENVEPVFGAPPLLSEQLRNGGIDAVLTFWPYAARLKAEGFQTAVRVDHVLAGLGIDQAPPLVGYVFRQRLADRSPGAVAGFFEAIAQANALLTNSAAAWDNIRPVMKADNDEEFEALKTGYLNGVPDPGSPGDVDGAEKLFEIMKELGGEKLLGRADAFDRDLFWQPDGASVQ